MPKPTSARKDKGFSLRLITEADSRFAVVKQMRKRLETLMDDAGVDTQQKEWLASRAVFIVGYLESLELDALEGTDIDFKRYFQATKSLSDLLSRLGLDREAKSAVKLQEYIEQGAKKRKSN